MKEVFQVIIPIIMSLLKILAVPLLLAFLYLIVSYFFLFPKLKVRVNKQDYSSPNFSIYKIIISNPSRQDIYNFEFSFRFDEKYPIKDYSLEEVNFKSGISLRSSEDFDVREDGKSIESKVLTSSFRGATDKFSSGTTVAIEVSVDRLYDESKGDIFPPTLMPELRSNAYYVQYKYKPLGLFAPIFLQKKGCYEFNGKKSKLDNLKSYKQKVTLSDGKEIEIGFEVSKKQEPSK